MADETTPAQRFMGGFAPKLVQLTDDVLFGDVWERPGLSKRDRSLITVASLVSMYRTEQLRSHLVRAVDNGLTQDELIEVATHLAFYAGWPSAMTAIGQLRELFDERAADSGA
jgi:4-carboxymuconolactone decarboxylase